MKRKIICECNRGRVKFLKKSNLGYKEKPVCVVKPFIQTVYPVDRVYNDFDTDLADDIFDLESDEVLDEEEDMEINDWAMERESITIDWGLASTISEEYGLFLNAGTYSGMKYIGPNFTRTMWAIVDKTGFASDYVPFENNIRVTSKNLYRMGSETYCEGCLEAADIEPRRGGMRVLPRMEAWNFRSPEAVARVFKDDIDSYFCKYCKNCVFDTIIEL